jgi:hypothetical protein
MIDMSGAVIYHGGNVPSTGPAMTSSSYRHWRHLQAVDYYATALRTVSLTPPESIESGAGRRLDIEAAAMRAGCRDERCVSVRPRRYPRLEHTSYINGWLMPCAVTNALSLLRCAQRRRILLGKCTVEWRGIGRHERRHRCTGAS